MPNYRPVALTLVVMKCFETDQGLHLVLLTSLHGTAAVRLPVKQIHRRCCLPVPSRLASKLIELGLNTLLSAWILDFLTTRPQVVRVGKHTSRPLTPQGCVLSPILYSLYTNDCVARSSSNTIVVCG